MTTSTHPSILIFTPVSNRAWVLPHFLDHIAKIEYQKSKLDLYFLINNSTDDSLMILREFKKQHQNEYNSITIDIHKSKHKFHDDRTFQIRNKYTYNHLSEIRNKGLSFSRKLNVDYLLSVDSDILVPPDILIKLISVHKPIISSLIYNGYLVSPDEPWRYTNIMKIKSDNKVEHISNWYVKNATNLKETKVVPVDVTGAISLISQDVINAGTQYAYHIQGEDIAFSMDAKSKGFQSYCAIDCFSQHIMSVDMLNDYKNKTFIKGEIHE